MDQDACRRVFDSCEIRGRPRWNWHWRENSRVIVACVKYTATVECDHCPRLRKPVGTGAGIRRTLCVDLRMIIIHFTLRNENTKKNALYAIFFGDRYAANDVSVDGVKHKYRHSQNEPAYWPITRSTQRLSVFLVIFRGQISSQCWIKNRKNAPGHPHYISCSQIRVICCSSIRKRTNDSLNKIRI